MATIGNPGCVSFPPNRNPPSGSPLSPQDSRIAVAGTDQTAMWLSDNRSVFTTVELSAWEERRRLIPAEQFLIGNYEAGGNTIRNSYFHNNTAMAIICAGDWEFINNVVVIPQGNGSQGITTYGCQIKNNTIINSSGQGIYLYPNANGHDLIENNIIVTSNPGIVSDQLAGPSPIARNNLILSQSQDIYESSSGVVRITRSKNISGQDPKFVNPSGGNYSLKPGSPAIGAATDGGNIGATR